MEEEKRPKHLREIESVTKEKHYYLIKYANREQTKLSILHSHVFRFHMSPKGKFPEHPKPDNPDAKAFIAIKSTADYGYEAFNESNLTHRDEKYIIDVNNIEIVFLKKHGTMIVKDKRTEKVVLTENKSLAYDQEKVTQTLSQSKDEFFFGGGMQNGRFTHKGEIIKIINSNNKWDDGDITSPCPFYWSTKGYGVLRNTWQPGYYDFGCKTKDVETTHYSTDFDAFYFINATPSNILQDYYELTGSPILLPEYAFYQAHLNTFNRDYWVKVNSEEKGAILFEDGCYYKSFKPDQMDDKKGILESLNGEKNNYQFSARAMIDRYRKHDLPLGWFVPNDGYGSGYGQTDSLDGDIKNLKSFGDYSRKHGVELAVWTESNLHPVDPEHPKKGDRDLNKEVSVAGVKALKADVAWIGNGYSFGLSAMQNAADTFLLAANNSERPMIITVNGWAGTQRCAGVWSGDQSGGDWEYIRFHIPTYIGSGLSGLPNIGSDMDGIFKGGNRKVNIRDFQWKAFTPIQLNMDGWGWVQKTPFAFDKQATCINRAYLKLKSMLMPYNNTIGFESIRDLPMIRAMFLEFPHDLNSYTKDSQYQFLWGPNILVAPIYNDEETCDGDSIRHGIYLPDSNQLWIDFLTGEKYIGGQIINDYISPLWKIPIFIRDGAIIPMCNPNNHPKDIIRDHRIFVIYPNGDSRFNIFKDDGFSTKYLEKQYSITKVKVLAPKPQTVGEIEIIIHKTEGIFKGIINQKSTEFKISASKDINNIKIAINGKSIDLIKATSKNDYKDKENVYYFDRNFVINPYLKDLAHQPLDQKFLLVKIGKINVFENEIRVKINGYLQDSSIIGQSKDLKKEIPIPTKVVAPDELIKPNAITLTWDKINKAEAYEIEKDDNKIIIRNMLKNSAVFDHLNPNTKYKFRVRAVTDIGVSEWSENINATTKENPFKNMVENVKATCSLPCQKGQEIYNLNTHDLTTLWHTNWYYVSRTEENIKINFNLQQIINIERFDYIPRADAGNGTLLRIKYRYSVDGIEWSKFTDVTWNIDSETKSVHLNEKFMHFEIHVLESIGKFGSGRAFLFFEKK